MHGVAIGATADAPLGLCRPWLWPVMSAVPVRSVTHHPHGALTRAGRQHECRVEVDAREARACVLAYEMVACRQGDATFSPG